MLKGHWKIVPLPGGDSSFSNHVKALGFNVRSEGVGVANHGVDDGAVDLFGVGQEQCVNFSSTDDHDLLVFCQRHHLLERHGLDVVTEARAGHHDVAALRERATKAVPCFAAHHHGFVEGGPLEKLQVR